MHVDRERFLFLVVALSHPGCGTPATEPNAPRAAATVFVPPPVAADSPPPPRPAVEPASASASASAEDAEATRCARENDTGTIDCTHLRSLKLSGPSCEYVADNCEVLAGRGHGGPYRRHAAQVAAACFDRLGARVCDIRARKKCYEEGVRASCPEPKFATWCDEAISKCHEANITPSYTREECQRALSAQSGTDALWAVSAMGPSSEGKCELMFTVF